MSIRDIDVNEHSEGIENRRTESAHEDNTYFKLLHDLDSVYSLSDRVHLLGKDLDDSGD